MCLHKWLQVVEGGCRVIPRRCRGLRGLQLVEGGCMWVTGYLEVFCW